VKCLSCGAQNSSQERFFVCDYCGAENVTPQYFDDKSAEALESKNLAPYKKKGINSFNRKKFTEASYELDKYLTIDSSDSEAWIFYALSEAELLKASNVDEKLLLISDALLSAKKNSKDNELINNSEVVLSAKILTNVFDAASVYFNNSSKRFKGFGGGRKEANKALEIINRSLEFPNHQSSARVNLLFFGLKILSTIQKRYKVKILTIPEHSSKEAYRKHLDKYLEQIEELYKYDSSKTFIDKSLLKQEVDVRLFLIKNLPFLQESSTNQDRIKAHDEKKGNSYFYTFIKWSIMSILICYFVILLVY
jgi:hypothetical protein